jgi:hypothetical protein
VRADFYVECASSFALPLHLGMGRGGVSSSAASSLTRIEPRAQTTRARASLLLREHAAYEDTAPLLKWIYNCARVEGA